MSRKIIDTGINPNDGTGDNLREAGGLVNDNFLEIYTYLGAGSTSILSAPVWAKSTSGISTTASVGIGTTIPRFALEVGSVGVSGTSLHVNGDARITGILTSLNLFSTNLIVGSSVTASSFYGSGSNLTNLPAGQLTGQLPALDGSLLTNISAETAKNVFWKSGTIGIHTLSNVGIGSTIPTSALTITGDASITGVITCNSGSFIGIITSKEAIISGIVTASSFETLSQSDSSKIQSQYKLGILAPAVGIGTTNPLYDLDVDGDLRVGISTQQGIILRSLNGTEFRLTISNAGTLNITQL